MKHEIATPEFVVLLALLIMFVLATTRTTPETINEPMETETMEVDND